MASPYVRWVTAALKNGPEVWAVVDRLTPDQRARAQAWVDELRRSRSLESRITRTVVLADDLMPGAQSAEEQQACVGYADRARSLAQAVSIAGQQRGRERLKARARIKHAATELQAEMIDFLMQRGAVAPLGPGPRPLTGGPED